MIDVSTRVLLVDDSVSTRKMLAAYFKELGFKDFEICDDGREALTWLTSAKPPFGLVFSDWHMPNLNGLDLLIKIRNSPNEHLKNIPVVLGTAERKVEEIKRAIAAGVNGYVIKPYNPESIKNALEKLKTPVQIEDDKESA
jgi:two-component system chemotaxis response regulator CheY